MPDAIPAHLRLNGRPKLDPGAFDPEHILYRGFTLADCDDLEKIDVDSIRFPDLSCNWSLFSDPSDIQYRLHGKPTDGCYGFSVETARYNAIATPVHDPITDPESENYSHCEVRLLLEGESLEIEPPKNRKPDNKREKVRRKEYRRNLVRNIRVFISALA